MHAVYLSMLRVTAVFVCLTLGACYSEKLAAEELLFDTLIQRDLNELLDHSFDPSELHDHIFDPIDYNQLAIPTQPAILFTSQQEMEIHWSAGPSLLASRNSSPDYADEVLLGVFDGGMWLRINKVELKKDELIVTATRTSPGSNCVVLGVATSLLHLISLKRDALPIKQPPVKLILKQATKDCY